MNRTFPAPKVPGQSRRGAAMVFALVSLLLASSMIAVLLRSASMSYRQLKRDELRIQSGLLADAGIARVINRLQSNSDFTEETWNVPDDQLSVGRTAIVRLKVTSVPEQPEQRIISAIAEFPAGRPEAIKVTRQMTLLSVNN